MYYYLSLFRGLPGLKGFAAISRNRDIDVLENWEILTKKLHYFKYKW